MLRSLLGPKPRKAADPKVTAFQQWTRDKGYTIDGKPLVVDGINGKNTLGAYTKYADEYDASSVDYPVTGDPFGIKGIMSTEKVSPLRMQAQLPGPIEGDMTNRYKRDIEGYDPDAGVASKDNTTSVSRKVMNAKPSVAGINTTKPNTGSKLKSLADSLVPFASNIANAFVKPPQPPRPESNRYVSLAKMNLTGERSAVERGARAAERATDANMPENGAEAVKAFNRGQTFDRISSINERENNGNIAIGNRQAELDLNVGMSNVQKRQDYAEQKVERTIAQQTQQSANRANAGEKIVGIRNEKEKGRVELSKVRTLATLYNKSGVMTRSRIEMKKSGIDDPLGLNYADVAAEEERLKKEYADKDKKRYGGNLRKLI